MRKIRHYFVPHHENNHRAHGLRPPAFLIYFLFLLLIPAVFNFLGQTKPEILGIFSRVTTEEIFVLVNREREKIGLPPLILEENLNAAAQAKGKNMLLQGYWAHVSPEGKTPWIFIQDAGYKYQVAGENLARNFEDSEGLVSAWMASPTHKRNILDPEFSDLGLAVLEGVYGGKKSVLVVQMFGKPKENYMPVSVAKTVPQAPSPQVTGVRTGEVNPFTATKSVVWLVVFLVAGLFVVDFAFLARKKIIRTAGSHMAHFMVLGFLILVLWYTTSGIIL